MPKCIPKIKYEYQFIKGILVSKIHFTLHDVLCFSLCATIGSLYLYSKVTICFNTPIAIRVLRYSSIKCLSVHTMLLSIRHVSVYCHKLRIYFFSVVLNLSSSSRVVDKKKKKPYIPISDQYSMKSISQCIMQIVPILNSIWHIRAFQQMSVVL